MENVNEETKYEDSMLRPMALSLADFDNVHDEIEESKELDSFSIWRQYRGSSAANNEEDLEDDPENPPDINSAADDDNVSPEGKDRSNDMSMVSRFARRQAKPMNERDVVRELQQVKNENFQLKLRVRYLEENQGLLDQHGKTEENVYKINVDLQVDKKLLENQIEEKDNCLREAITAIEQLEREKEQNREKIEALRRELEDAAQKSAADFPKTAKDQENVFEAFQSMNLGAPPNDEVTKELKDKVSSLERELEIERDTYKDIQATLAQKEIEIANLQLVLEDQTLEVESVKNVIHKKDADILEIQGSLRQKESHIERLEQELLGNHDHVAMEQEMIAEMKKTFADEVESLREQSAKLKSQLELEQKSIEIIQVRHDREMEDVRNDLVTARKALEEETEVAKTHEKYVNEKLSDIINLTKENEALKIQIAEKTEENCKLQTGLDAVAQVTDEQSDAHVETLKELKKKNLMFDRLLQEYEIAKAKVRKYRSERTSSSSSASIMSATAPEDKFYLRQGANKALEKANSIYNERIKKFDAEYSSVLAAMQSRLEQLAICLERILRNGSLEDLSDSMRDILERSLNESRRFSMANRTLDESVADLRPEVPHVEVTLDDLELELGPQEDLGAIMEAMKQNYEVEMEDLNQHLAEKQKQLDKITEKNSFMENEKIDLRIKLGNSKEKVRQLEEEVAKLSDKSRTNKLLQEIQQLKTQLQVEIAAREDIDGRLNYKDDELERLKAELEEAKEKLRKFQLRKEQVDKVLRHQLAKTHQVLKSTKSSMDNIQNK